MALPQSLNFLRIGSGPQALEVWVDLESLSRQCSIDTPLTRMHRYLDPQCPFSAKITESIHANVLPLITKGGKHENKLHLIVRLYPQPL
jgi:hypothetical protein